MCGGRSRCSTESAGGGFIIVGMAFTNIGRWAFLAASGSTIFSVGHLRWVGDSVGKGRRATICIEKVTICMFCTERGEISGSGVQDRDTKGQRDKTSGKLRMYAQTEGVF